MRFIKKTEENSGPDDKIQAIRPEAVISKYLAGRQDLVTSADAMVTKIGITGRYEEKQAVKVLEYILTHKDEIATMLNRHNLSILHRYYGDKIKMSVTEKRLCKEPPKPSGSVFKSRETIRKNRTRYNGGDIYFIYREYSIPVKDTSSLAGYRGAINFARGMKFNPNAHKDVCCPYPPHVTPDIVAYNCNRILMYYKLCEIAKEKTGDRTKIYALIDFTILYYPLFRDGVSDIFKKILAQGLPSSEDNLAHDLLYPYLGLPKKLLTPSVVRHLLSLPVRQLEEEWGFLDSLCTVAKDKEKAFRKIIYNSFRKGMSPEEIKQVCDRYSEQEIIKEYNLSHKQLEMVTEHYLPVIRKYKQGGCPLSSFCVFSEKTASALS